MHPVLLLFLPLLIILGGCEKRESTPGNKTCIADTETPAVAPSRDELQIRLKELQRQYDEAGTVKCCERYIQKVINEGSNALNLPAGEMAAGYSSPEDAEKIAAYVVTLSGKTPTHPEYVEEGNLYYDGNCAGCHGEDGMGLGGAFPDLTLPMMKGAKLRKTHVAKEIESLKERLESPSAS